MKKNSPSIFALSTPLGISGISVVRVSGKNCKSILESVCPSVKFKTRYAHLAEIRDEKNNFIDKGVVIFFKSPNSFTGEDMIEFQIHGGIFIIKKLLSCLSQKKDTRAAEPGEFIKRAFMNKKISLIEVEGTHRLIKAETKMQALVAQGLIGGKTKLSCDNWKNKLLNISAHLDALIDFSEEDEQLQVAKFKEQLEKLILELEEALKFSEVSEEITSGINILILGPPNAGKSSLFNLVNQEEKSIVTSIEGTTRDLISSSLDIRGYKVNLIDSAGLRVSSEAIEKIGIKKIFTKSKSVEKFIIILSPDSLKSQNVKVLIKLLEIIKHKKIVIVFNKNELEGSSDQEKKWQKNLKIISKYPTITTSCVIMKKQHRMYSQFVEFVFKHLIESNEKLYDNVLFSEVRHLKHISNVLFYLKQAILHKNSIEIMSEDLRLAIQEIECISGRIDYEKKLDFIFTNFCIGK